VGDTIIALSQNTRTSPVLSVVVLVRTPTAVPGLRFSSVLRVVGHAESTEDGAERDGCGVQGDMKPGLGEG